MKKTLLNISILAMVGGAAIFTSCREDFDYNEAYRQNPEFVYRENFEKAFGTISPDQSWDFTNGGYSFGTRANVNPVVTKGEYYNVQSETLKWLTNTLKESTDNRKLGTPFIMSAPAQDFTIVPIYQGQAGMTWDLHLVVGSGVDATDNKIWSKSQGIQTSTNGTSWSNLATSGKTIDSKYVRATPLKITGIPAGTSIYFYLEITSGMSNWATKGTKQSSLSGMMLSLNCPLPTNVPPAENGTTREVMIIGCEDANLKSSDWDLNDIVFLVWGNPELPKPIEIKDNTYDDTPSWTKRYMVEDLGATETSDIDFNDIVVDFKHEAKITHKIITVNGEKKHDKTIAIEGKQTITVKALGGTKDIALYVGEKGSNNKKLLFQKSTAGSSILNKDYREGDLIDEDLTKLETDVMYNTGYYGVDPNYDDDGIMAKIELNDLYTITKGTQISETVDGKTITIDPISYSLKDNVWNHETNNVWVVVFDEEQESGFLNNLDPEDITEIESGYKVIEFPADGTVPAMIAVKKNQKWNHERVSVFPDETDGKFTKNKGCELKFQDL